METWRRITTWGAPPEFNMGLDEALLEAQTSVPTLRLYSWNPATLSLGYFQRWGDVPGTANANAVVRRITGGGAIHHTNELTFSITAPLSHELYRGPIRASYERVHHAIAAALREVGVDAAMRGSAELESDVESTGMCFHKSTDVDLAWGGMKGVGSAQRRTKGRVLHHGSIKLGSSSLEGAIATLDGVRADDLAPVLSRAFSDAFSIAFETSVPDPDERERARELGERYASPEFLRRR